MPDPGSTILSPNTFLAVLDTEMVRAERYNYFLSVLLFQIVGPGEAEPCYAEKLAQLLLEQVRRSDYVGLVDDQTVGVILPFAAIEAARTVLDRLRLEALLLFSTMPEEKYPKASWATYPSEATSLSALLDVAWGRLS